MAKKRLIEISLTDFIDFVSKTGSTKMTQVKTVKGRDEYHPAKDFYKYLREGIVENHKNGGDRSGLDDLLTVSPDPKKRENFKETITGYKKFWGRKTIEWFDPPHKHWRTGDLDVRVNPELGLEINGKKYVVKLYLKAEKLSKTRINQILNLLEAELRKKVKKDVVFAVLDVRQGKLYCNDSKDTSLYPLLTGEAMSFATIWNTL